MSKPKSYGPAAEVLGPERRRRWSKEAKAAIVAETYAPGVSVSEVARRHGIAPSQVFARAASSPKAARRPFQGSGLVHHSDRGSQYIAVKYTERLAQAGIERSVGSVGDSYDNAMAETIIGLYKTEIVEPRGPWKSFDAVEYSVAEWVAWFNTKRLLGPIGDIPPAEAEDAYWKSLEEPALAA